MRRFLTTVENQIVHRLRGAVARGANLHEKTPLRVTLKTGPLLIIRAVEGPVLETPAAARRLRVRVGLDL